MMLRILAFDASTRCTGVALVAFDTDAHLSRAGVVVERCAEFRTVADGTTDTDRLERLRTTRQEIALWLSLSATPFNLVAYEEPPQRGADATGGLHQSIGCFMTLTQLAGFPVYAVHAATVKKEQGLSGAATARVDRTTKGAQEAKRRALKLKAVEWANRRVTLPAPLAPDADAIADAVGVALGAFHRWQNEQYLLELAAAQQGKLSLRATPKPRSPRTVNSATSRNA